MSDTQNRLVIPKYNHAPHYHVELFDKIKSLTYDNEMKQCKKCTKTKELSAFHDHPTNLDGKSGHCIECQREYGKKWYAKNAQNKEFKQKHRESYKKWASANRDRVKELAKNWYDSNKDRIHSFHLKATYGISREQYDLLLQIQGHKCKICPVIHKETRRLHVDHDHSTGLIRGLLCTNCNRMLGFAKDNPITLANAVSYLENNSRIDDKSIFISDHSTQQNGSGKTIL